MRHWLLLRGWTREAAHWGCFPDALREALPGDRIDALDLPGAGRRHRERTPTRMPAIMESLRERARVEGLAPPFHLLGLSMGGMAATEWARRHGDEIAALVLVNTSARPFCALHERLRPSRVVELISIAARRQARAKESAIFRLTTNARAIDEAIVEEWARVRRERPVSAANALRQLAAAATYRAPATAPCGRVLVMSSARDRLVNPRCSEKLAAAWGVPLVTHPTAGHDLPLEDAVWLARETARWATA